MVHLAKDFISMNVECLLKNSMGTKVRHGALRGTNEMEELKSVREGMGDGARRWDPEIIQIPMCRHVCTVSEERPRLIDYNKSSII